MENTLGPVEQKRHRESAVYEYLREISRAIHDGEWQVAQQEAEAMSTELRLLLAEEA